MRFYNLKTNHTQDEIDEIIMSLTPSETDYIIGLYGKISMVEYTDNKGFECMFAILDDFLLNKLDDIYSKYLIKFEVTDITKDVILDNKIKMSYKNHRNIPIKKEVSELIIEFKTNWVSKDDILDKIIEKGIDSLTQIDFEILES